MTKYYCDACGKELKRPASMGFPVHVLVPRADGYVDNEGNSVSGRMVEVELCHACYNKAYHAALKVLTDIGLKREDFK